MEKLAKQYRSTFDHNIWIIISLNRSEGTLYLVSDHHTTCNMLLEDFGKFFTPYTPVYSVECSSCGHVMANEPHALINHKCLG